MGVSRRFSGMGLARNLRRGDNHAGFEGNQAKYEIIVRIYDFSCPDLKLSCGIHDNRADVSNFLCVIEFKNVPPQRQDAPIKT
ncbi:hypothetical protein [Bacillus sp. NTK074B]|uniref:hypothetical protein n=1 Tax=Bacillus sp. NTK074B TaxID=2802174 RepID=UPI001A8D7205